MRTEPVRPVKKSRWIGLGVLAAVLLLLAAVRMERGRGSNPVVQTELAVNALSRPESAHAPSPPADAGGTQRRARVAVPRFNVPAPEAAPAGVTGPAHPRRLATSDGGLKDRRPAGHRSSPRLRAELDQRLEQANKAVEACLDEWPKEDPSLRAGVMLVFTLDERGLDEVWIEDATTVPSAPLECISNSLYPIDWSGLTVDPLTVSWRLRYGH
jgi:hypothetical protein